MTFAKGQKVTMLRDWDRKGTITIRQDLTVYSCGTKRMILVDEAGVRFAGAALVPQEQQSGGVGFKVVARVSDEMAEKLALEMAADVLAAQREHFARCLARHSGDEGYCNSIRRSMAGLHEPKTRRHGDHPADVA
jgi:hypothetical protein